MNAFCGEMCRLKRFQVRFPDLDWSFVLSSKSRQRKFVHLFQQPDAMVAGSLSLVNISGRGLTPVVHHGYEAASIVRLMHAGR
jgi:hypothetical protein